MTVFFKKLAYFFNPPWFELEIHQGKGQIHFGALTPSQMAEFEEVAKFTGLEHIALRARGPQNAKRLEFLSQVPEPDQQRFRNVWNLIQ